MSKGEQERRELKANLLQAMCDCAENLFCYRTDKDDILDGIERSSQVQIHGKCPACFKPGVADKFLFNHLLEPVLDEISEGLKTYPVSYKIIAANILGKFYYPQYGSWDKNGER